MFGECTTPAFLQLIFFFPLVSPLAGYLLGARRQTRPLTQQELSIPPANRFLDCGQFRQDVRQDEGSCSDDDSIDPVRPSVCMESQPHMVHLCNPRYKLKPSRHHQVNPSPFFDIQNWLLLVALGLSSNHCACPHR